MCHPSRLARHAAHEFAIERVLVSPTVPPNVAKQCSLRALLPDGRSERWEHASQQVARDFATERVILFDERHEREKQREARQHSAHDFANEVRSVQLGERNAHAELRERIYMEAEAERMEMEAEAKEERMEIEAYAERTEMEAEAERMGMDAYA